MTTVTENGYCLPKGMTLYIVNWVSIRHQAHLNLHTTCLVKRIEAMRLIMNCC